MKKQMRVKFFVLNKIMPSEIYIYIFKIKHRVFRGKTSV